MTPQTKITIFYSHSWSGLIYYLSKIIIVSRKKCNHHHNFPYTKNEPDLFTTFVARNPAYAILKGARVSLRAVLVHTLGRFLIYLSKCRYYLYIKRVLSHYVKSNFIVFVCKQRLIITHHIHENCFDQVLA